VSIRLKLDDLRRAREAKDPELVDLIVSLAEQPEEAPETPPRKGAPTFERFLATIRSRAFSRKSPEERGHYRVEQLKALEAPDAEVPPGDKLRLHEIILDLWREDSLFARTCLLEVIARVPLAYGPWRALKRIFKESEAANDTEVYGALAARLDAAFATPHNSAVSTATLGYLARRAWRYLRRTGVALPVAYADRAADVLAAYPDDTNWRRTWVANHVFYHESGQYGRNRFTFYSPPADLTKQRAFADLWRRSPRPLFSLLERAKADQVRAFAVEALKADFRSALREVEPEWVARLVAVGSKAVDGFVVWILSNVPRFEQGAFRTLGLHEAVLRLFDSPAPEARAYAAGYARTHARDLPVAELVRLADNTSPEVRALATDLIRERDPRKGIGLEAWGWLLETKHGHELAAEAIRKHFGAAELTPEWFKQRLFTPSREAFRFLTTLLAQVHPTQKLGAGFFVSLIDAIEEPGTRQSTEVAVFATGELAKFDINTLDAGFLRRLLLHPSTQRPTAGWIDEGRLKAQALPLDFLKALAYRPAWDADAWLAEFRQTGPKWARGLDFNENLSARVLDWLGDVRRFSPADLGLDWLLQLVDRPEPNYHDFAVETMIKGFAPADFAPRQPVAAPTGGAAATVDLAGASVLFTGKLASMQRKDAEDKVKAANGTVAGSVTKKLHYLVMGDEGSPLYSGGKKGDKQLKAEQLNAAGANIHIISETAFLQMLTAGPKTAASADSTRAGCERLWAMAVAPGAGDARRAQFARLYVRRHHPELGPSLTDRPVDPGAEVPLDFLTFDRVRPLFAETRKPLRDFALELARWDFVRWKPSADVLLELSELPHADVRRFVAEALLAEKTPENRHFRIDPDGLPPAGVYRFCESPDPDTRLLGIQIIRRSPRLQLPEELFRLTESPDRVIRGFVIRSLWALYRDRGLTEGWKAPVPPAPSIGAAAKKAAAEPPAPGPGVPERPDKPPAAAPGLSQFLRRVLFEVPPARPETSPVPPDSADETGDGTAKPRERLKPLPARRAKLELVELMRDLALEDGGFAEGILPLLEEFMTSRGRSERAACLVAVTRIRHKRPALPKPAGGPR
jgi:hypothetical protein